MFGLRDFKNFSPDRQYIAKRLLRVATLFLACFVVFYLFYHVGDGFQTKLETDFARTATAQKTITMEACLFRDESVITVAGGTVRYYHDEYEKLGANELLATVYSSTSLDTRLNVSLIDALDRQIELLTEAAARAQLLGDASAIDGEISNALVALNRESESGRYANAVEAADTLLLQISRKELQQSSKVNYSSEIKTLTELRDTLDAELNETGTKSELRASALGGYFTRSCDGYETVFDYDKVMSMSLAEFNAMTESAPSSTEFGKTIGKTIDNYKWYVVARVDRTEIDNFRLNRSYSVDFPDNDNATMTMTLERTVTESGSRESLLIFSCKDLPANFSYTRFQNIKVSFDSVSGLQVSRSAIRLIDDQPFVYTLDGATVNLKAVDIIDRVGGYYYMAPDSADRQIESGKYKGSYKGLRENDCVITYGIGLSPGLIFN